MKIFKSVKQSFFCAIVLSLLFTSCSEQRYTYYNIDKKNTAKVKLDKPADINSATEAAYEIVPENKEQVSSPTAEVILENESTTEHKTSKKSAIVKNVAKAIEKTIASPSKMLAKAPSKINNVFATNSNTMDIKDDGHGHGGLLWTIIVIVLILWLLGFLVGDLGAIIHLLLVIALILIVLTLLGAI